MNVAKLMAEKPWRSSWPETVQEAVELSPLPDVPWKGQVARYRKVFQAVSGVPGSSCSVADAQELFQKMQSWSDRHTAHFTWPPSEEGWARAVWATMSEPQGKEDMAWLWAVYAPSVRVALSERPSPQPWATAFLRATAPVEAVQKAAVEMPRRAPVEEQKAQPASVEPVVEKELSPEVRRTREWLNGLLSDLSSSKEPEGVISEKFDRALKEFIETNARPGANRVAGWIEYNLIPAVVGLDAEKMNMLVDLWPAAQAKSFIDPQKTVSSKKFWAMIEDTSEATRGIFLDRFLPAVIDPSEWSSSQRYDLAVEMFEWTKRRPQVFRERLRLWQAWGGRLDDVQAVPAAEGNMFSKVQQQAESVEAWVKKHAIPEWDAAIAPSPRNQRRP